MFKYCNPPQKMDKNKKLKSKANKEKKIEKQKTKEFHCILLFNLNITTLDRANSLPILQMRNLFLPKRKQ